MAAAEARLRLSGWPSQDIAAEGIDLLTAMQIPHDEIRGLGLAVSKHV
jgi:hypothetical protein